ncbi:uncharacterized protein LOC125376958 isoform X2 [Haliotis rufescens]|uniref:uncharacterized protein LOC124127934 isoform X2 n=1 Tax=Haliotis rufescens TaxID=6454 RepID=UPI00201FA947|nr:uncharacterized protein LOC124127934 isoform X2 [Haliotis rufescens]XP_048245585.1 uncharacterized protein LOC125376958 isoform X2 [Haliotis rufescens]
MSEADVAAVICCAILCEEDGNANVKKERSCWTKDWILRRDMQGAYNNLIKELEIEDEQSYYNFFRMGKESFNHLLLKVQPKIKKQDTNMRECLPAGLKLAVTLRFLSSGDNFQSLSYLYRVPSNTICTFVPEVCQGIYEALQPEYAKVPSTQDEWKSIVTDFEDKWQFPNCFGAMDGKHFAVTAPAHSGSQFYNYKGYFSIIMLALVDANYKFTFVDVGANGRAGDAGIFANSDLLRCIEANTVNIPSPKPLPGRQEDTPHVIQNYYGCSGLTQFPAYQERSSLQYTL